MAEHSGEVRYEVRGPSVRLTIARPEHRNAVCPLGMPEIRQASALQVGSDGAKQTGRCRVH